MEMSMAKRVGIVIIIIIGVGLIGAVVLGNYYLKARADALDERITAVVESNRKETEDIRNQISDLCSRLSKIEEHLKEKSTEKIPFKIVDDDG
jgi:hypothetical protein